MVRRIGPALNSLRNGELPPALRRGPLREGAFSSPLHDERVAARLGTLLGIAFTICFLTGLVSHFMQHPAGWMHWPASPVWLYRVTQGMHVATGTASIPLLVAKLWTVYPKLFEWPPARSVLHALERGSLLLLVGGASFQLVTGLINVARFYPWHFFFTTTHYWVAWITIGAMLIHVAAKITIIKRGLRSPLREGEKRTGSLSRRGFITTVGLSSGAVTLATVGQTVAPLQGIAVLSQRRPDIGPQHVPVNKSAAGAGVQTVARKPDFRLLLDGPRRTELSLQQLQAMPQHTVSLPITCVEGWSAGATWTGIRIRDLADLAGFSQDADIEVESLQQGGLYRTSVLRTPTSRDHRTVLALRLNGEELDLDHGYPCRLIAPNRPGVLQTKWVTRLGQA